MSDIEQAAPRIIERAMAAITPATWTWIGNCLAVVALFVAVGWYDPITRIVDAVATAAEGWASNVAEGAQALRSDFALYAERAAQTDQKQDAAIAATQQQIQTLISVIDQHDHDEQKLVMHSD